MVQKDVNNSFSTVQRRLRREIFATILCEPKKSHKHRKRLHLIFFPKILSLLTILFIYTRLPEIWIRLPVGIVLFFFLQIIKICDCSCPPPQPNTHRLNTQRYLLLE